MAEKKKKIIFYSAVFLCTAAVIARSLQFFLHTDLQTGRLDSGNTALSVLIAVFLAGALVLAFFAQAQEGATALGHRKESFARVFMFLSAAALFYDFVRQCINVYGYLTKNSYVKWNYVIPLALFGALALICALYFFVIALFSNNKGYDFTRINLFHYVPLFWAVFGLLTSLSTLEDLHNVQQAIYKTAALIFATLFFMVYAASFSQPKLNKRVVSGLGFSYSFVVAVYAFPELMGLALGVCPFNSVYFAGTFLLTGAFAFSVSRDMVLEK